MVKEPASKAKVVVDPIPKWNLIPDSEARDREIKYLSRLADVTVSAELIKSANRDFRDQEVARAAREHWEHFLRCDGLPRPYLPVEVRTFIAKMRHYDEIETNSSIDWTLAVDERSILNQNIFRVDRTRPLMKLTKDNPGTYYDNNVQMCLDTLKQMDVMLDNEAELARMTKKQQYDIMDVYTEVQHEIEELLNRLTYRVLKMQGAYMNTDDGITATWSYKCKPWELDLWGLLNVPIRFDQLELPVMLAEMKASGVEVQIPTSVLKDCLTLRSVHTEFDIISQNAKSYEPAVTQSVNYPNAGIADMQESVANEWALQQDIQFETLTLMINRRQEYEEMMVLIAEKTEQAARAAKQGDGEKVNIAIPKAPKEPPAVPPGMVPDIYNDFIRMEDSQYAGYLDEVYHPRHLDMREFEINLRECIILGGIYAVMFIRRPDQTQFQKFNIILHEDGRILHTMPELKAQVESSRGRSTIRRKTRETYRGTKIKLDDDELPYFIVTLQLPADLCKWSEPEVCQFITEQEPVDSDFGGYKRSGSEYYTSPGLFKEASYISERMSQSMIRFSRASVDTSNIFRPTLRTMLRQSKYELTMLNEASLEDFPLKKSLNHIETRNLERYCLPRIISSFKMPRDVLDEIREGDVPKTGMSRLVKRPEAEETQVQQVVTLDYTYEDQANTPERMFPFFPNVDPILYADLDDEEGQLPGSLFEPTALGVLKTLDTIKSKYLVKPNQLLSQPDAVEKKSQKSAKGVAVSEEKQQPEIIEKPAEKPPSSKAHKRADRRSQMTSKSQMSYLSEKSIHMRDVTHWTKRYIMDVRLDRATHRLTFKTDRLGIFGLAFKRYEHFPFRDWSLQPNEENPDELILTVDTFHVRIFFYITTQGVRGYVTDLSKGYTAKPVKYLEIKEPISDFGQMRQLFISKNINIFAEHDASFYIENGYFSMKHVAAEQHTYSIMALHCKLMKFYRSSWNRLSSRRDIIMNMKLAKDTSDYSEVTLRITPEKTTFVQISENCSDQVDVIVLSYTETWRNISHFTDLHQAINSMVLNATELRNKDSVLLHYVTRMLQELRVLSFS